MSELERLAEVAVVVGANVQPGQVVQVTAEIEQLEVVRAIADAAYRHGARFVDPQLRDPALQRSLVVHGPAEAYVPNWADAPTRGLDEVAGARIMIIGPTAPGLLDDLDPVLVNRAQPPRSRAWRDVEYRVNNTIIPGPHQAWAQTRYPRLTAEKAQAGLWRDITVACRLDAKNPVAVWRRRFAKLTDRASQLTRMRLEAIRLHGPGTNLEIGLLPDARWEGPTNVSERGVLPAWNLPSEEIYTSPDPARVNGRVRLTRPAVVGGATVEDVTLTFLDGAVTEVTGGSGVGRRAAAGVRRPRRRNTSCGGTRARRCRQRRRESRQAVRSHLARRKRRKPSRPRFRLPRACHEHTRARVNQSGDHLDLTIGSRELRITGLDRAGGPEQPLMRDGRWVLTGSDNAGP